MTTRIPLRPALAAVAAAAAAVTVGVALLCWPASAPAASWLQSTVYMRWPPDRNFGTVCTGRTIRPVPGLYDWRVYVAPVDAPQERRREQRRLRLRRSVYRWRGCILVKKIDTWPGGLQYIHCSFIDHLRAPRWKARLCGVDFYVSVTRGYHHYGSRLDRIGS